MCIRTMTQPKLTPLPSVTREGLTNTAISSFRMPVKPTVFMSLTSAPARVTVAVACCQHDQCKSSCCAAEVVHVQKCHRSLHGNQRDCYTPITSSASACFRRLATRRELTTPQYTPRYCECVSGNMPLAVACTAAGQPIASTHRRNASSPVAPIRVLPCHTITASSDEVFVKAVVLMCHTGCVHEVDKSTVQ